MLRSLALLLLLGFALLAKGEALAQAPTARQRGEPQVSTSHKAALVPASLGFSAEKRSVVRSDSSAGLLPSMGGGEPRLPDLRLQRLVLAAAGLVAANTAAYAHFHKVWWDHPRTRFHLYRGWRRTSGSYDLGFDDSLWHHVDKCGHLYSASLLSRYGAATARWVGLSENQADWAGFALASLLMLEIELYDGFFAEWGFSLGDLLANEAGAAFPILQRRHPRLQRVNIKWSYHPSGDPCYGRYMVEDYAGMTFWLCLDAHLLLPQVVRRYWPDVVDVAVGYGTTDKIGGRKEVYLALDLDLRKVHFRSSVLRTVAETLNIVHMPAPTVRIHPRAGWHLLYL
ncbi:MAG: DUF2279 domain-containing protein [bacterium]|nr:YfiM family protein [candidate division KSB1 bacterium]MDH7559731.1 DUF2279 domain-containing protein [bacterium]